MTRLLPPARNLLIVSSLRRTYKAGLYWVLILLQPETHAQKNPAFPKGGVLLGKLCFPIRKNHPRKQTRELRHLFDRQWRVHLQAQPQPIRQARLLR